MAGDAPARRKRVLTPFFVRLGFACTLLVVLASAAIRLNAVPEGMATLRALHRAAASLEALVALWLAWQAWRGPLPARPILLIVVLTVLLAALGIVAGKTPMPVQALGNLLGGLALLGAFAWLLGEKGSGPFFPPLFLLVAVQAVIGARLALFGRTDTPALPLHAELGIVLAALLAWIALARVRSGKGAVLFVLALAAPVAGFTVLHYERSALAALVHAASAALLIAGAAAFLHSQSAKA